MEAAENQRVTTIKRRFALSDMRHVVTTIDRSVNCERHIDATQVLVKSPPCPRRDRMKVARQFTA
jgi:hypothetical protein